jgi:hypothetical protein
MRWSIEPASDGVGVWFVGRAADQICVIAAPGSAIATVELRRPWRAEAQIAGWRLATWAIDSGSPPNLDRDPPTEPVEVIDTCRLLSLVDVRLHGAVEQLLLRQLRHLEAIDLVPPLVQDPDYEPAAHQELAALAWARSELATAFAARHGHLLDPGELLRARHGVVDTSDLEAVPETVDELERRQETRIYTRHLGGVELWRLLRRRILWRLLEKMPEFALIATVSLTRRHWTICDMATRQLAQRCVTYDWPPIGEGPGVKGRMRAVLARERSPNGENGEHHRTWDVIASGQIARLP